MYRRWRRPKIYNSETRVTHRFFKILEKMHLINDVVYFHDKNFFKLDMHKKKIFNHTSRYHFELKLSLFRYII